MEIAGGAEEAGLVLLFGDDTDDDDDDEDDWEVDDEWLMALVTPLRATLFPSMTYGTFVPHSVIDDLCVRMGNLEYEHGDLVKKMDRVSDAQVADDISIRRIWPRVTTVEGQVQVMVSHAVQVVSRLKEIKTRVQQVESRVDTHPSEYMAVQGHESRESTLMSYMLWMEERLAVLEKKLPGPPPGPQ
ncbi:hypothetical protein Tco_0604595 [Tanacetum coccineum]